MFFNGNKIALHVYIQAQLISWCFLYILCRLIHCLQIEDLWPHHFVMYNELAVFNNSIF